MKAVVAPEQTNSSSEDDIKRVVKKEVEESLRPTNDMLMKTSDVIMDLSNKKSTDWA